MASRHKGIIMTVNQFVDQLIQHDDELIANFPESDLAFEINEARTDSLESIFQHLTGSGWDPEKLEKMDDEDIIAAERDDFYELYESLLYDRIVHGADLFKGNDTRTKESFIKHTFKYGTL